MMATRKILMACFVVLTAAAFVVLVSFVVRDVVHPMPRSSKQLVATDASINSSNNLDNRPTPKVIHQRFKPQIMYENKWDNKSIPKIIHQTFKSEMVYENYRPLIQSCLELNPDWKYYLWRDADAVALIKDKYPQFLRRYNSYTDNLERSDSIRYMVLHQFGGIYLDMDVECVRPFYPALSRLPAFLDQERTEQTNIFWSLPYLAMNSVMGSIPGHQFFGHMVDAMLSAGKVGWAVDSTGPFLLTRHYARYMAAASAVSSTAAATADPRQPPPPPPVFLMPPSTFSPLMDDAINWRALCRDHLSPGRGPNNSWTTIGCRSLASKGWRMSDQNSSTIAIHRFLHLGYLFASRNRRPLFNIIKAFPDRVNFYS